MKDRKDMLAKEIAAYGADIICLQVRSPHIPSLQSDPFQI